MKYLQKAESSLYHDNCTLYTKMNHIQVMQCSYRIKQAIEIVPIELSRKAKYDNLTLKGRTRRG